MMEGLNLKSFSFVLLVVLVSSLGVLGMVEARPLSILKIHSSAGGGGGNGWTLKCLTDDLASVKDGPSPGIGHAFPGDGGIKYSGPSPGVGHKRPMEAALAAVSKHLARILPLYLVYSQAHETAIEVHGPGADIDTLYVWDYDMLLEKYDKILDFFSELHKMLSKMDEIEELHHVLDAHVPVMGFKFHGISIDLYANVALWVIPEDLDISQESPYCRVLMSRLFVVLMDAKLLIKFFAFSS
nr:nuclear poly(A) polymerase 1 [Ipomoea batatas]